MHSSEYACSAPLALAYHPDYVTAPVSVCRAKTVTSVVFATSKPLQSLLADFSFLGKRKILSP